ncbi:MAG: hypothetical protein R3D46_00945 [Defluviimonas denitrificans]
MLTATDRDAEGEDIVEEKTRGGMSFTRFAPEATRTARPPGGRAQPHVTGQDEYDAIAFSPIGRTFSTRSGPSP